MLLLQSFLFAWLGMKMHHAVARLAVLGAGVRKIGEHAPPSGPGSGIWAGSTDRVHRRANLLMYTI